MRMSRPVLLSLAFVATALLVAAVPRAQAPAHLAFDVEDYVEMPITGELDGANTRGLLARLNYMREEPGGRRVFINDLNGPLYILDTQTKALTTYLDFNGLNGRPGLFRKLTFEANFATGLISFVFDPDYLNNGVFYTMHMEDPATQAPADPRPGAVAGLDLRGYTTTPATTTPAGTEPIRREVILVEWTDRDISNTTFEGTARELLRLQHPTPIHPMAEMTFNPVARPGDPEWRVMYIAAGDAGSGERTDVRRLSAQRLDTLTGKILRIVPDLRAHTSTTTISENGRYRVPNDNPFAGMEGARKEIWASGVRNPHRMIWDVDPARPTTPRLLAFHIGLVTAETVIVIHKGANYGWPLREGIRAMSPAGAADLPADDTIPVRLSETVTRGTIRPTYPVIAYPHARADGGDAIAGGFIYQGTAFPELRGKLVFGDITVGRIWYADMAAVRAADDGIAATLAPTHDVQLDLRALAEAAYRRRGGRNDALSGVGAVSGRGRVDMRFAVDGAGEPYLMTKSDGMIRRITGVRTVASSGAPAAGATGASTGGAATPLPTANPVARTPASITAGKALFDANCAACHGGKGEGAVRARATISIIEEQNGRQPPDLTDAQWDHGSTDAAIFAAIKRGVPPTMMAGYDGRIADQDIWHLVNYIRSLGQ